MHSAVVLRWGDILRTDVGAMGGRGSRRLGLGRGGGLLGRHCWN